MITIDRQRAAELKAIILLHPSEISVPFPSHNSVVHISTQTVAKRARESRLACRTKKLSRQIPNLPSVLARLGSHCGFRRLWEDYNELGELVHPRLVPCRRSCGPVATFGTTTLIR